MKHPVCRKCRHYFIIYEPANPHGCRAMNFKSKQPPSHVVYANSGIICQLFKAKNGDGGEFSSSGNSGGSDGIVA